jgi:hypothetical protein
MRSKSTNYFFLTTRVAFLAAGFVFFLEAALAVSFAVWASAFFFAATLAVVEPLEGIAIGPFLDPGLEALESQGLRLGDFLIPLKILAMSS